MEQQVLTNIYLGIIIGLLVYLIGILTQLKDKIRLYCEPTDLIPHEYEESSNHEERES